MVRPSSVLLGSLCLAAALCAQRQARAPREVEGVVEFRLPSALLSEFWGREIFVEAGVVLPPGHDRAERLPVCYSIHGFGGSHRSAWRSGAELRAKIADGYPRMLYVFLNARCPLGHHEFADSVNNGPWGSALTLELIPALEAEFGAFGAPAGRFLTGHSSGGWSSLWLQVNYPDFFDGTWSTAPDSVDFRDFTGIDVYAWRNAYQDPEGQPIQLMRRRGEWVMTIEEFVRRERARREYGGQFASFDAVFSPRGEDGRPMPMFDRETGAIDAFVAKAWEKYDISLILRRRWQELGPRLAGKLHVFMGTLDTFRLEGALRLMADELRALGSDAQIVLAEGRDHGTLFQPHAELWPDGMLTRIHREMRARFDATRR
jgi:hypothetical protein